MRKCILPLILLTFALVFGSPAFAGPPASLEEAKNRANQELSQRFNLDGDYFTAQNAGGRELRWHELTESGYGYWVLTWGDYHPDPEDLTKYPPQGLRDGHYRYVGYTYRDEDFTNPTFPHDAWGGGYLEDRNWIKEPWNDSRTKSQIHENKNPFDGQQSILQRIQAGLIVKYSDVSRMAASPMWNHWHEYVHILVPPTQYTWGMGRAWHQTASGHIWYFSIPLPPGEYKLNLNNLVAVSLDPGVSGEADPGAAYTAAVTFRNDSDRLLTQAPVGAFNWEYRAVLKDAGGSEVQYADFGPREEKTFYFTWHAPDAGEANLTGVINTDPLEQKHQETTYDDNKVFADVPVRDVNNFSSGDRRLHLQAYSKPGNDIYGEWHDSRAREPFTAKWTDDVHATLTVDRPTPPRGWLDWWEISWAKITYPRIADDFSFGNPVPPDGTVTKWMNVPGRGLEAQKQAKLVFEEDWALDGFPIHNMMTGEDMAVYPKEYPISASFEVKYQYTYCVRTRYGCTRVTKIDQYTDTATTYLLVNGAGTIPY